MKNFQEKRRFKKVLYSNFSLIILAVLIVFLGKSVWSSWQKYSLTKEAREQSEERLTDLNVQRDSLSERTTKLGTDRGKEEFLRERYDVAKEGEGLINVVPGSN